jgi:putative ABC transport system ATP-binding protein
MGRHAGVFRVVSSLLAPPCERQRTRLKPQVSVGGSFFSTIALLSCIPEDRIRRRRRCFVERREWEMEQSDKNQAPLLEADKIGRRAPSADKWLLRDVSVRVDPGARVAIVGPSGSGKSLLLRALALLDPIHQGSIRWRGSPADSQGIPAYRRQVMYLHQQPAIFEGTVEENLRQPFALRIHAQTRFEKEFVIGLLGSVGRPPDFLGKSSTELSGGERQIVVLIRAMQLRPTILLLDEPTAALDKEAKQAVEQLLEKWLGESRDDRALVQVSHDPEAVKRMAHQILHMEGGQLEESH